MLAGFDFTVGYSDDVLIQRETSLQYSEHIQTVFQRIKNSGFKLREEKSQFVRSYMNSLAQIIDANQCRSDPSNMPASTNLATLQSFLGLATYYSMYVPNMYKLRASPNKLLK